MKYLNMVQFIGNIANDPFYEKKTNGHSFASFRLATNKVWMAPNGEKREQAEFHPVIAWERLAELVREHLKKSKLVYVTGHLHHHEKQTDDGKRFTVSEIVAEDIIILSKQEV